MSIAFIMTFLTGRHPEVQSGRVKNESFPAAKDIIGFFESSFPPSFPQIIKLVGFINSFLKYYLNSKRPLFKLSKRTIYDVIDDFIGLNVNSSSRRYIEFVVVRNSFCLYLSDFVFLLP